LVFLVLKKQVLITSLSKTIVHSFSWTKQLQSRQKTQFTYVVARWIFRSGGLDGICDEAENGANPEQ